MYIHIYTHTHTQEVSTYCSTPLHTHAENYNFFQSTLARLPSHTYFCKHTPTQILLHTYSLTLLPDAAYQIGSVHVIILELPITSRDTLFAQRKEKIIILQSGYLLHVHEHTHSLNSIHPETKLSLRQTHTRKHTHTQIHTHANTRTHTYTHAYMIINSDSGV